MESVEKEDNDIFPLTKKNFFNEKTLSFSEKFRKKFRDVSKLWKPDLNNIFLQLEYTGWLLMGTGRVQPQHKTTHLKLCGIWDLHWFDFLQRTKNST